MNIRFQPGRKKKPERFENFNLAKKKELRQIDEAPLNLMNR